MYRLLPWSNSRGAMRTDFEHWLTAQFAEAGPFAIFILLVRIDETTA